MKASFLKRVKWVPALAAAAALSLVGVGISTPADAAVGNINPDTPSSLTIHKYDGDQQERGDGTEIDDPSSLGDPLDGVEFTITPVTQRNGEPIDLDTAPGWDLIDGATVGDVKGGGEYARHSAEGHHRRRRNRHHRSPTRALPRRGDRFGRS